MKLKKIFLLLSCVIVLAVAGIWYFIFYRPTHYQRDILSEQAITVTAEELVKKYETNEQEANNLFLNKVIAVTGKVAETGKNQAGKTIIYLQSTDPFSNVSCTMKSPVQASPGANKTIRGICTGYLSDVILIDAVEADNP